MSTIYTFHQECPSNTVNGTDRILMWNATSSRTAYVPAASVRAYVLGVVSTQALGFFGATATVQPTSSYQAAPTSTLVVSQVASPYGFTTSTQGDALVKLAIQLRADMVSLGLIKGS